MIDKSIDRDFAFGPFRVLPRQRLLMESERPVRLGSRALEILIALIERAGEVFGKAQLMAQVWPHSVVEEAALRKALGDGRPGRRFIATIPQRGYSFVAPIRQDPVAHLPGCPCGATLLAPMIGGCRRMFDLSVIR